MSGGQSPPGPPRSFSHICLSGVRVSNLFARMNLFAQLFAHSLPVVCPENPIGLEGVLIVLYKFAGARLFARKLSTVFRSRFSAPPQLVGGTPSWGVYKVRWVLGVFTDHTGRPSHSHSLAGEWTHLRFMTPVLAAGCGMCSSP